VRNRTEIKPNSCPCGCRLQLATNHIKYCVVYFLQLIRDYVCCFLVRFFQSSSMRAWFIYTLEIRSTEINRQDGRRWEVPNWKIRWYKFQLVENANWGFASSVTKHINKMNSILAKLTSVGIKFDDEVQTLLLISSLPDD